MTTRLSDLLVPYPNEFAGWHEKYQARQRGERVAIDDPRLDDVTRLSSDDIADLALEYGEAAAFGAIAAAAQKQLRSVKLIAEGTPSGARRARLARDKREVTEEDAARQRALRARDRVASELRWQMACRDPESVRSDRYRNHDFSLVRTKHELAHDALVRARMDRHGRVAWPAIEDDILGAAEPKSEGDDE